ncbi:post-transcriptional regulator [Paenilisteria rocourtiae]|uniref:ComN-like post-transcriptional regulator n=1 Tax=Listeria rocourtiae TaxID=647910 RepID=A0A4R6ZNA6_9LIST|nr:post-transcriptional regulator [Listeria rocourtiae]MBC1603895.1 hypothetical protein [Listeria rocourtiae]TDR53599.1 ComN-like post-transcriptional regulator [Listeria rocourtiae]
MRMGSDKEWYDQLETAILIRVEDFRLMGYREIEAEHIWSFLVEVVWKDQGDPRLHQRIHDILQMKIASLMDFITLGPPEEVAKEEVLPQPTDGQE